MCAHGFAMSLCASLLSAAQREEAVPYLESPAWEAFVAPGGRLTAWEQTQNRQLGGRAPLRDMDNESDDEVEFDAAEMQRVIAAQTAAAQAAADGDGDGGAERSSEYLQHIAQYLSERNFVNDLGDDLDALAAEQPPAPDGATSAWAADFDDFDAGADGAAARVRLRHQRRVGAAARAERERRRRLGRRRRGAAGRRRRGRGARGARRRVGR